MLENLSGMLARIQEIKSRFGSGEVGGVVTVAPRRIPASGAALSSQVEPFFPTYLVQAMKEKTKGSVSAVSAYDELIEASAAKHGVDPALVKAVIQTESGFNANAVSPAGAKGLMQLMPPTAAALGLGDPFDPDQNIDAGTRYLKQQLDRFGNVESALAAYNAGPAAVARYGGVPPYRETQDYVNRVLSYREAYSSH